MDQPSKISFYAFDLPGKYVIVTQGITPDGRAGSKMIEIDVKAHQL